MEVLSLGAAGDALFPKTALYENCDILRPTRITASLGSDRSRPGEALCLQNSA